MTSPRQLDLFKDSDSVRAANALLSALTRAEATQAQQAYDSLLSLEPSHPWLLHAKTLIEALRTPLPKTAQEAQSTLAILERDWMRAAETLFPQGNHECLAPKWRAVAGALECSELDSSQANLHPSYAYAKLRDWFSVERSILATPNFELHPLLLTRIAEAVWHLERRDESTRHWFSMCWLAPKEFDSLMDRHPIPHRSLHSHWLDACDHDMDPPPTGAWFPAWTLLQEPGLARLVPNPAGSTPEEEAFAVLQSLTLGDGKDTRLRKRLQELHPGLLKLFLKGR